MLSRAEKAPRAARKSGRSTSPRAVERRRLQNRISQRKHRQTVRATTQDIKKAPQDAYGHSVPENAFHENHQDPENKNSDLQDMPIRLSRESPRHASSSGPHSPLASPIAGTGMNYSFMGDDFPSQQVPSWPYIDPMMKIPMNTGNENRTSQSSFTPQTCYCNGTTGPCPAHLEQIRAQVLAGTNSPLPLYQQHQNHHAPNPEVSTPHPPLQTPRSRYSLSRSGMSGHVVTPGNLSPVTPPESSSVDVKIPASNATAADITRRFGGVLEAMRTSGFQDFDDMALAYYTAQFEKGSFPAMVQCASRSRRLKAVLQELYESSSQWPRWESRGLYESISEATASICVEEMERLKKAKVPNPIQSEPADIISAFEWLLSDHGCNIKRDGRSFTGGDAIDPNILSELTLPGEMEAAPDSMPYLWSLVTELAGAQGLYCDRFARIVLAILVYARGTQR